MYIIKKLLFNGENSNIVVCNSLNLSINNEITLNAWIFPTDISGTRWIISKSKSCKNTGNYGLSLREGQLAFSYFDGTGDDIYGGEDNVFITKNDTLPINQWSHVAVTYNFLTGKINFYINGAFVSSVLISGSIDGLPVTNFESLYIGRQFNPAAVCSCEGPNCGGERSFDGKIDEIQIYNRALTSQEIQDIYNVGSVGICGSDSLESNEGLGLKEQVKYAFLFIEDLSASEDLKLNQVKNLNNISIYLRQAYLNLAVGDINNGFKSIRNLLVSLKKNGGGFEDLQQQMSEAIRDELYALLIEVESFEGSRQEIFEAKYLFEQAKIALTAGDYLTAVDLFVVVQDKINFSKQP